MFGDEYGIEENEKLKLEFLSKVDVESLKKELQHKISENDKIKENNEKVMKELMLLFDEYPDINEIKKNKKQKDIEKNMKLCYSNVFNIYCYII